MSQKAAIKTTAQARATDPDTVESLWARFHDLVWSEADEWQIQESEEIVADTDDTVWVTDHNGRLLGDIYDEMDLDRHEREILQKAIYELALDAGADADIISNVDVFPFPREHYESVTV